MPRPDQVPLWAINAAFASPGDSWDTDPTKVTPPAGKQAEGWEPTGMPPAEFLNWWQEKMSRWIEHLAPLPLDNLFPIDTTGAALDGLIMRVAFDPAVLSGKGIHVAHWTTGVMFGDGETWETSTALGGAPSVNDVASDGVGLFVLVGGDAAGVLIFSSVDGDVWTARTPARITAGELFRAVVWDPSNSLWIAAGDDGHVETSPDAITWTDRTPGFAATERAFGLAVDPANGIAVAVLENGDVWRSANGGVTWVENVGVLGGGSDVAWSPGAARFVAVGGVVPRVLSEVFLSSDGTTWVAATTPPAMPTALLLSVAADEGYGLISVGEITGSPLTHFSSYSSDGGDTWTAGRHRPKEVETLGRVSFADGRFYLSPGNTAAAAAASRTIWKTLRTG